MTSVNIKYPVQKAVEDITDKHGLKQTLSEFTHQAVQERIERLQEGSADV